MNVHFLVIPYKSVKFFLGGYHFSQNWTHWPPPVYLKLKYHDNAGKLIGFLTDMYEDHPSHEYILKNSPHPHDDDHL